MAGPQTMLYSMPRDQVGGSVNNEKAGGLFLETAAATPKRLGFPNVFSVVAGTDRMGDRTDLVAEMYEKLIFPGLFNDFL